MALDDEEIYRKHEIERSLGADSLHDLMDKFFHGANLGEYENIFDFYKKTKPSIGLTVGELNEILQEVDKTFRIESEMVNYIKILKKKYKIAILSNFSSGLEKLLKDVLSIHHLFDVVVSSYNLKISKPDSKIYYHTLEKLNVKADEVVFVDDMERNTQAAEKLGIKSIIFQDFSQFKKDLNRILD